MARQGGPDGLEKAVKVAHLVAGALLLGGIGACVALDATGHLGDATEYARRRAIASDLTWALLVPGCLGVTATGALLAWRAGAGLLRRSFIGAKQAIGMLVLANAFGVLVPLVRRIDALLAAGGPAALAEAAGLQRIENGFGAANLALALVALALAVFRPSVAGGVAATGAR